MFNKFDFRSPGSADDGNISHDGGYYCVHDNSIHVQLVILKQQLMIEIPSAEQRSPPSGFIDYECP
jgi:hypothetical protein